MQLYFRLYTHSFASIYRGSAYISFSTVLHVSSHLGYRMRSPNLLLSLNPRQGPPPPPPPLPPLLSGKRPPAPPAPTSGDHDFQPLLPPRPNPSRLPPPPRVPPPPPPPPRPPPLSGKEYTGCLVASLKPTMELAPMVAFCWCATAAASLSAKSSLAALMLCLLYPVGPVGCWPRACSSMKSSTWSDGGLEVLGGRDRNPSERE